MFRRPKVEFFERGRIVVLRPRFFSARRLKERWRAWMVRGAVLSLVGMLVFYGTTVRANILQFHPGSCLGNWHDISQALGKPDLSKGAGPEDFSSLNSARFSNSGAEIFCGNFQLEADQGLEGKRIKSAKLFISWRYIPPAPPLMPEIPGLLPAGGSEASSSPSGTPAGSPDGPASSSAESVPATSSEPGPAPAEAPSEENAEPRPDSPEPVSEEPSEPAPAAELPPPVGTDESSEPEHQAVPETGWLLRIFPEALAMEAGPDLGSGFEPVVAPEAATTSAPSAASSSPTLEIPFELADPEEDPPTEEILENFFDITFTVDGEDWVLLSSVVAEHAEPVEFTLPLKEWSELENFQVNIQGFTKTPEIPSVFLDGLRMEIEYEAEEEGEPVLPEPAPAAEEPEAGESLPEAAVPAPAEAFDPFAKHACFIDPFTREMFAGEEAELAIRFQSPEGTLASSQGKLGDFPAGIEGELSPVPEDPARFLLKLRAHPRARPGSYSLSVLYREFYEGVPSLTSCQFNLIVRPR